MIECAADAIVAFSTNRTVLLWNPAAERMFGWAASEVVGLEPQLIPEELKAEHNAVTERVRGGGQISFATRRIRKDGTAIDLRIDTSALIDGAGQLTGWVNVCHQTGEDDVARGYMAERARVVRRLGDVVADMNAQRDLESVLDRIAASLRELTSADAGGFVLIEDDTLRLVSTAGLPHRLRGRTADLSKSLVGELMRSGNTVMMATGESGGFDDLIWSALPGLHTIALSLSHVAGRPYGALYALYSRRNLSHVELELLELLAGHAGVALTNAMAFEEVVRQRAHERAVIDGSADGIAVLDAAGLVRQWNPAAHRITGLAAPDAIGTAPSFPLPDPGATLTHKLPNGRWLDVLCTALADGGELVIDFRDVTAAKELEEAKDLFLATTSHELRTPITVVQGFASTLASRWDQLADAERRSAVQTIAERAGSLGRLVEQLLLGSRAGADQLPVRNGPFDLGAVLRAAATAFRPLSDKHVIMADIPDGLPAASGDTMATDIIVGQLLENAFKYSPDGGTVSIRARVTRTGPPETSWPGETGGPAETSGPAETGGGNPGAEGASGGWIEVTVEDEGIGIPAGDHERIFDRFFQGEAGDRRRFGGVGIGLFIVRRLAHAQHGEITASSRPAGGTAMCLLLRPAAAEP
ncbi:MAG: PAS domain S-box protein [Actinomycetota bacterium]|nr:PAS domain S-box protein [Actinomycetota bacterium]